MATSRRYLLALATAALTAAAALAGLAAAGAASSTPDSGVVLAVDPRGCGGCGNGED